MILVTGATGTNGRLVVRALLAAGARVRAMVQDSSRAADLQQVGAELVTADFDQTATLDRALAGVERCLLLSAVDQRLVERETRFVERAKRADLKHLVKFSAIGAHPATSFTFGRQHGTAERMIMDSGLPFTFVQPNFFMQNLLWSAETIGTKGEIYSTLGSTPASHVDARDIAAVIAATLTQPIDRHVGCIYLVTGPAALSFDQVAETLSRVVARAVRYVDLTSDQLKGGLLAAGQSEWQATALIELNTYARQGHASVVTDTVERVGGRPARTLEQWVRNHVTAFRPEANLTPPVERRAFLCRLLPPRPTFMQDMTADERAIMEEHGRYWRGKLGEGDAIAFGPVADPAGAWGLGLIEARDDSELKAIQDGDPAIKSNLGFRYESLPMPRLVH
jgi:uncharacterized protein YbjT (DUF2867 family)